MNSGIGVKEVESACISIVAQAYTLTCSERGMRLSLSEVGQNTRGRFCRPSEPLSEKLINDKIGQFGKWYEEKRDQRLQAFWSYPLVKCSCSTLLLQDTLRQVDDVVQTAISETHDQDFFGIE